MGYFFWVGGYVSFFLGLFIEFYNGLCRRNFGFFCFVDEEEEFWELKFRNLFLNFRVGELGELGF